MIVFDKLYLVLFIQVDSHGKCVVSTSAGAVKKSRFLFLNEVLLFSVKTIRLNALGLFVLLFSLSDTHP